MAITSGFYNSVNGDRKYYAEQVNTFFEGLVSGGVYESVGGALRVVASDGMNVLVSTGKLADTGGRWLRNDSEFNLTIENSDVLLNRYDAIIAKIDSSPGTRGASIYVKTGEFATDPVKPTIERSDYVEEYCLAYVYVGKGVTAINQENITDARTDRTVCGFVYGLIDQVDTTEIFSQYNDAFYTWFSSVKSDLASATLIRSYSSNYTTSQDGETIIPINIPQFNRNLDIFQAYINGLRLIPGVDYTINNNSNITLTRDVDAGTEIAFEVYKSVDGSDAETVVSQVNEIETLINKYSYQASGDGDNVTLSQIIQSFLNGGDDYAQIEIDVIGTLGCSAPYSGDGTAESPYIWLAIGQSAATSRRVRLNFGKCDRITVDATGYDYSVLFGGNDAYISNCQAVMNNAVSGKILEGERVVCDNSEFWLNGTGDLVGGGCCGTFTNCRMSVTSQTGTAYGFSANGNVLRLVNCEVLAYNATSVTGEAVGVLVEASKTENVLVMSGCNLPVTARNGYKQSQTVKINSGYYCLTGNILGKAAAKYAEDATAGKTDTGTMIISK